MAKTIVIQTPSWLERHPVQIRRLLVRLIFSEATEHGWQIRTAGQRWDQDAKPTKRPDWGVALTEDEWAMLIGRAPS